MIIELDMSKNAYLLLIRWMVSVNYFYKCLFSVLLSIIVYQLQHEEGVQFA